MKYLPPEMEEWYFPFNWEVKEIWELDGKIEQRPVENLAWHLKMPFWSTQRGKGMLFDLKPIDVLDDPNINPYHTNRINQADENYPIILVEYKNREVIIDGIHRLAKLTRKKVKVIDVKKISGESIETIAKYA